jgi:hypothetical protein
MTTENEIILLGSSELSELFINCDDGNFEDLAASPWQDFGEVKMNRGDTGFVVEFGGQKVRPESLLITILGRKNYYARRSYFLQEDTSKPLCTTPLVDMGRGSKTTWIGKDREDVVHECSSCKYGTFGGPCRETRLIWVVLWTEDPDGKLQLFADIPFNFSVPLTSINMTDGIVKRVKLLTVMKNNVKTPVPLLATVWRLKSEVIKKQGFTYSRLLPPELIKKMPSRDQYEFINEVSDNLYIDLEQYRREHIVPEGSAGRIDPEGSPDVPGPTDEHGIPLADDGKPVF